MTPAEFVALVRQMREAQRHYFKCAKLAAHSTDYQLVTERQNALRASRDLEAKVDAEVDEFFTPSLDLRP